MKTQIVLEFAGNHTHDKDVVNKVKELWIESGNKIKDIKSLDIYLKPEESMIYYVINQTETGSFPM